MRAPAHVQLVDSSWAYEQWQSLSDVAVLPDVEVGGVGPSGEEASFAAVLAAQTRLLAQIARPGGGAPMQ